MKTKKVLIAETSAEFCEQLSDYLGDAYTLRVCHSGIQARELLSAFRPDVLVMDLALPELDGISLLKHMIQQPHRPRVLLTTCCLSPYVEGSVGSYGVDMVMLKPCNVSSMADQIYDLTQADQKAVVQPIRRGCTVAEILMNLEIPTGRKAFEYLQLCIELYQMNPCQSVTKSLYPQVARVYGSNAAAVERAIRQAIHASWSRRDESMWRQYFRTCRNGTVPRPTNLEFISRLAELQKQQREAQ